jgi:hypothetical protein
MAKEPVRSAAVAAAGGFLLYRRPSRQRWRWGPSWGAPRGAEPTRGNSLWVLD